MKMVFTKMSVSNTRSKKSISQVQSAEKVGLAQVQSADTAVELTMPDFDQKRDATMPDFDQKRGATMPDFDQKRGAMKFAFGLKKKDSRRICLIAGLLLLHISCASAMQEEHPDISAMDEVNEDAEPMGRIVTQFGMPRPSAPAEADPMSGLLLAGTPRDVGRATKMGGTFQTRKTRHFKFRWVQPEDEDHSAELGTLPPGWVELTKNDGQVYYLNKGIGSVSLSRPTGGSFHSSKGCPEIQYWDTDDMGKLEADVKAKKPDQGFKVYAGIYYKKVDDERFWGVGSRICALRLWSGMIATSKWLAQEGHAQYRELKNIEDKAQRIDDNPLYWVQKLEFRNEADRQSFILHLGTGLAACLDETSSNRGYFGCHVTEIADRDAWDVQWKNHSAMTGQIQAHGLRRNH